HPIKVVEQAELYRMKGVRLGLAHFVCGDEHGTIACIEPEFALGPLHDAADVPECMPAGTANCMEPAALEPGQAHFTPNPYVTPAYSYDLDSTGRQTVRRVVDGDMALVDHRDPAVDIAEPKPPGGIDRHRRRRLAWPAGQSGPWCPSIVDHPIHAHPCDGHPHRAVGLAHEGLDAAPAGDIPGAPLDPPITATVMDGIGVATHPKGAGMVAVHDSERWMRRWHRLALHPGPVAVQAPGKLADPDRAVGVGG